MQIHCKISWIRAQTLAIHLAADTNSLGKQSIGIGVVQVPGSSQPANTAVSVAAVVVGTLDLGQVRSLVDDDIGAVSAVAGARRGRVRVPARAVVHVALARHRVGDDGALARAGRVGAADLRVAARAAAALRRHVVERLRHRAARARRRALEVLLELGRGRRVRRRRRRLRVRHAARQRRGQRAPLRGAAVRRDHGALQGRVLVHARGLRAVHRHLDGGGLDAGLPDDLGAIGRGVLQGPRGRDVKVAAGAEVVDFGYIPLGLDGLAGSQSLELTGVDEGGVHEDFQAAECDVLTYIMG